MGLFSFVIPVVAIVLGICVAFWAIYWDYQTKRLQYEERRLMIERGMVPPPVLPESKRSPEEFLRKGIIKTFLGVGLAAAWIVSRGIGPLWPLPIAAAIVGFLGLGHIAYYFIARSQGATTDGLRSMDQPPMR